MKKALIVFALLLAGCQPSAPLAGLSRNFQTYAHGYETTPELPFTAKIVDDEAERLARQWSPTAAPTHVQGLNITSEGIPHIPSGSWTFSFIDTRQRDKGLQIVLRPGLKPVVRRIAADKLPQREPLEIRAWGIDSPKAIIKARQYFGTVSLKAFELTAANRHLVWAFGPKSLIEAMDGSQYVVEPGH
ncbi:MAG TPA: hypothetical protein V6D23_10050 [Candidatus Obscuribacterales bacterium]